MTEDRTWVRLDYRAGNMMPGVYHVTPSQADAIRAVNQAIRELIDAFGLGEPSWEAQLYGLMVMI